MPAVLYGAGRKPRPITVSPRHVAEILRSDAGQNTILKLQVPGQKRTATALICDYEVDPITHRLIHADFKRISMTERIEVNVPIEIVGEAVGVRVDHGILDQLEREVPVRCLPTDIPDSFELDVTGLGIHDVAHLSDLEIPEGVELLGDPDQPIATVAPPTILEVAEPEDEEALIAEGEEPELIGAERDDDEDQKEESQE
ncbi:MAG: 50S ribosomal protein L25 [Acidobacteriota bacterium]|nr:50S ribosomal protein L25 [Acidobacteriota bacterium]